VHPGRRALPHQEHLRLDHIEPSLDPDHRCRQARQVGQLGKQAHKRLADPGQPGELVLVTGVHVVGDDLARLGVVEQDLVHVLRCKRGEVVVPALVDGARRLHHNVLPDDLALVVEEEGVGHLDEARGRRFPDQQHLRLRRLLHHD